MTSGTPAAQAAFDADVAQSVSRRQAARLRRAVGRDYDQCDLSQELLLEAWRRWDHYDPCRSTPRTFLTRVAQSAACSLLRARFALKRRPSDRGATGPGFSDLTDAIRRLDVAVVVAGLPLKLQQICRLLQEDSVAGAARRLAVPRHQILKEIKVIRSHFVAAGLEGAA